MSTSHTFLSSLRSDAQREALAKLPEWRKREVVARAFPGTEVGGLDFDEALVKADAAFTVRSAPLTAAGGIPVTSHCAVVRTDTRQVVGVVGSGYGVVQHHTALAGLRDVCQRGLASLESISVEDGGTRLNATALLGFSAIAQPGRDRPDALAHFARVSNAHDGSGAVTWGLYVLRLVCLNGLTARTLIDGARIKHTSGAHARVAESSRVIGALIQAAKDEVNQYQLLASQACSLREFVTFGERLLTETRGAADSDRKVDRRTRELEELARLFEEGAGNVGATKYDALNAVTDWLSVRRDQYKSAARFAAKFRGVEHGQAAKVRTRALRLLAQ